MKKRCFLILIAGLFLLLAMTEVQAQTDYTYAPWSATDVLPNGQPAPLDFMTLGDSNHTYVRCAFGNSSRDYNTNPGTTGSGLITSHALLTPTNGGYGLDPCRCYNSTPSASTPTWKREKILPPSWEGDPDSPQDKVIRLGCYREQGQCLRSQEIEYWFYPPKDSSTLLVMFSFAAENVDNSAHTVDWNPKFFIEVLDGTSGQVITSPGQYYRECDQNTQSASGNMNTHWPYNCFLASPPGCTTPACTPCGPDQDGVVYYYWAHTASTPSTPTTFQYQVCPAAQTQGNSSFNVTWFQYKPLAFDLSSQAAQGRSVKLRIRAAACNGIAHWAYGLFTAKLVPGYIKVDACGNDDISLSVPWGFHEGLYQWYCGTDPISCNQSITPGVYPGVNGTMYNVSLDPTLTRIYPYYRCEMKSYTGIPFTYEAYIKRYQIDPTLDYEQVVSPNDPATLMVNLHGSGTVTESVPNVNGLGFDTVAIKPGVLKWYYKNSAGDYREIPESYGQTDVMFTISNVDDLDLTDFDFETGSIGIMLVVQDSMQNCSESVERNISLFNPVSVTDYTSDQLRIYPNPTTDVVSVVGADDILLHEARIIDMAGRVLKTFRIEDSQATLNVRELPAGNYLIEVRTSQGTVSKPIVKR